MDWYHASARKFIIATVVWLVCQPPPLPSPPTIRMTVAAVFMLTVRGGQGRLRGGGGYRFCALACAKERYTKPDASVTSTSHTISGVQRLTRRKRLTEQVKHVKEMAGSLQFSNRHRLKTVPETTKD